MVKEMVEIAVAHAKEGRFRETLFRSVAEAYRSVVEDAVLELEKAGDRKHGRKLEDVTAAIGIEGEKKEGDCNKRRKKKSKKKRKR